MSNTEEKHDFDAGLNIPSLEETIAKIKSTAAASEPQEPAAESAVPVLPVATAATEVATTETAPATTAERPQVVSGALRKLLERESALIERENKLKAAEAAATPAARAPDQSLASLRALYKRNKVEALRAIDPDFKAGVTAKELWYHDLGDLAPKEARAELQSASALGSVEALQYELEETKREVLQQIEQHKADLAYQSYVGAVHNYTATVPDTLPLVKQFTAKKPEKVVEALIGVARKHAQATNGQVLTPQQAAAKLEASLRELQFAVPAATGTEPTATRTETVAVNTLRNKHTSVQASREIPDDLDDKKLMERALAEIDRAKKHAAKMFPG